MLAAFSLQLLQLLNYRDYKIATIDKLQKQIALHRQILDNDRRPERGRDIDGLSTYNMFSPHAFHDCVSDAAPDHEATYSLNQCSCACCGTI